ALNRNGTCQGITGICMAMKEGFEFIKMTKKTVKNFFSRDGCRQRQISSCNPLRHTHKIRRYSLFFTGEHVPCSPESCCDLIGNKKQVILFCYLPDSMKPSRRLKDHSCGSLYKRFNDYSARLVMMFLDDPLKSFHTGKATRLAL